VTTRVPEFEIEEMDGPFILRWKNPPDFSAAELLEFSAINDVLQIERECDGSLLIMAPITLSTNRRETRVLVQLSRWAEQDGTGEALGTQGGYYLPNGAMRGPDAAWIRRERIEALPASEVNSIPRLVPDFVVEVRSESNRLRRLKAKMEEYIANGVRLGWPLDPTTKTAYVYRAGAEVQVVEKAEALDASPELPGFVLDLAPIWKNG
jgi:Uma2 family endonuclease